MLVSSSNSYVEILMPDVMVSEGGWGLGDVHFMRKDPHGCYQCCMKEAPG